MCNDHFVTARVDLGVKFSIEFLSSSAFLGFRKALGTQITMLQCTTAGGRAKGANEKSFVFVQHDPSMAAIT